MVEADATQSRYLITGELTYKKNCEATFPKADSSLKGVGSLTSDNLNQKAHFLQLTKFVKMKLALHQQNLILHQSHSHFYEDSRKNVVVMDDCRFYMAKMRAVERMLLKLRVE